MSLISVVTLASAFSLFALTAGAMESPASQVPVAQLDTLRGRFVQDVHTGIGQAKMQGSGSFVAAPAHGLIWKTETPLPSTTVATPDSVTQRMGNIAIKLPVKKLADIYRMVSSAISGDWSALQKDFTVKTTNKTNGWEVRLAPRTDKPVTLNYAFITVTGNKFVENIVMMRPDGEADSIRFTDTSVSHEPLAGAELALLNQ